MNDKKFEANIEIETSFYSDLSRMNMSIEEALKEFIDNSTTSFEDNRDLLESIKEDICKVHIEWNDEEMVITDNAFGMEKEEFQRALKLSSKPESYSEKSRGQYGIGLKNAAANIGRKYSVSSEQFNSNNRYYAEMDLDEMDEKKPKTIPVSIYSCWPETHKTEIRITKLLQPFSAFNKKSKNADQLDKLLMQLGKAYSKDLLSKTLEIVINGRRVEYSRPELLKNKETGGEYIESFDSFFMLNGKEYHYSGWIGILKTGDTKTDGRAGFTMMQKDRAIQINYKPSELLGTGNNAALQRIVGEIYVEGKNWIVSFAKNRFQWTDNGLEQAFIDDLKANRDVMNLIKFAKNYKKNSENVNQKQIGKMDLNKAFDGLQNKTEKKVEKKTVYRVPLGSTEGVKVEPKKEDDLVTISYNNSNYVFHIIPSEDKAMKNKFILLKINEKNKTEYDLLVNTRVQMFDKFTKNSEKELIVRMALSLALAQLSSKKIGLKEDKSQLFIDQLNDILVNTGKE